MRLKIKWNDDRVRGAATAVLLIARDRLSRGETGDLIRTSLAEYRSDIGAYKMKRATWAEPGDPGPFVKPSQVAFYASLRAAVDRWLLHLARNKRQFNSLLELDNAMVAALSDVR